MKKKISLLLCGVLTLSLAGCGQRETAQLMDPTVVVETAPAQTGALSTQRTYIGTISSEGTANVIAEVSARVEAINVAVGDTVTAGQQLCVFDDSTAQLTLQNAQATYNTALTGILSAQAGAESAQAALQSAQESYNGAVASYGGSEDGSLSLLEEQVQMAQDYYDDTLALFEIGAASQLEVDQARQNLNSAKAGLQAAQSQLSAAAAGVQQAQAAISSASAGTQQAQAGVEAAKVALASAEYQLSLFHLSTPISGIVEAVNVTQNNYASAGTLAFVISNASNKTVTFYVTDAVRGGLIPGQAVTVTGGGSTYTGAVTEIGGVVDARTGLFQIKAIIDDAQTLPDGLTVELSTVSHTVKDAVIVPSDALYFDDGRSYVYLARDGAAVRVPVTVGLYTADSIAITEGLQEGDEIIVSWSANLTDGAPIRLYDSAGQAD